MASKIYVSSVNHDIIFCVYVTFIAFIYYIHPNMHSNVTAANI